VLLPGLESLQAQFERVQGFLSERHAARGGEEVSVIVSHALTIELAMLALLGLGAEAMQRFRFRLSNTGVHIIENDAIGAGARLLLVNSLSHLGRWV
jgi:5''-phosphoribostamycin phosphatase/probable phosphoglycerate mutase